MKRGWKTLLLLSAFSVLGANASANVLFSDSYDRADNLDIDADTAGMGGSLAPLTYVEKGDIIAGDGFTNIKNNQLYLADGPNASSYYLDHNFTDSAILTDGGMKIGYTIASNLGGPVEADRWCGFGVGNSANEVEHSYLDYNVDADLGYTDPDGEYYRFRGSFDRDLPGVSDFLISWSANKEGIIQVFKNGTTETGGENYAIENCSLTGNDRLEMELFFDDFNAGTNVDVNILWNGAVVGTDSFAWDNDNSNYIGFSTRQATGFVVDDLEISTVPEPGTIALLGLGGLVLRRRK